MAVTALDSIRQQLMDIKGSMLDAIVREIRSIILGTSIFFFTACVQFIFTWFPIGNEGEIAKQEDLLDSSEVTTCYYALNFSNDTVFVGAQQKV